MGGRGRIRQVKDGLVKGGGCARRYAPPPAPPHSPSSSSTPTQGGCQTALYKFCETQNFDKIIQNFAKFQENFAKHEIKYFAKLRKLTFLQPPYSYEGEQQTANCVGVGWLPFFCFCNIAKILFSQFREIFNFVFHAIFLKFREILNYFVKISRNTKF